MSPTPLTRMKYAILPQDTTLLIDFHYRGNNWRAIYTVELLIENLLREKGVGQYDREGFVREDNRGTLCMHGRDAHAILSTIQPLLRSCRFIGDFQATMIEHRRYQPAVRKLIPIKNLGGK